MVTVKMVKDAGFDFASNDRIITGTINKVSKRVYNLHRKPNSSKYYDDRAVDCFCFRDMTHHIDLNAGMIVDVVYSTNVETTCDAGLVNWGSVKKWRPSMQNWKIETPEEAEAFDIMAQDNEQMQDYEIGNHSEATNSSEWKSGDICYCESEHDDAELAFIGMSAIEPESKCYVEYFDGEYVDSYYLPIELLSKNKPETQEQREERERLEAAYDLYLTRLSVSEDYVAYSYSEFLNEETTTMAGFLAVVDKTGYRKQKDGE